MNTYLVEIVGTITHTLRVEANSVEDAEDTIWQRIEDGETPNDLAPAEAYVNDVRARELYDWEQV